MDKITKQVNVEEIMAEIRKEIEDKGYKSENISFSDIPFCAGRFEDNIGYLHDNFSVAAYRPLESGGKLGALNTIRKKILRKLIKFYIEPIVEDQNENNKLMTACLNDLFYDLEAMRKKVKSLEEDIKKLEESK